MRSGNLCSNPNCRRITTGPSVDIDKSISLGKACHICAASPNGPRYDPKQSTAERKHINNGIWLCSNCSDLVDKDKNRYTVELLLQWRENHESFVQQLLSSSNPIDQNLQVKIFNTTLNLIIYLIDEYKFFIALDLITKIEEDNWETLSPLLKYRVLSYKAKCYNKVNKELDGAKLYIRALQYNLDDEKALSNVSYAYVLLKDVQQAKKYANAALEKNPFNILAITVLILISPKEMSIDDIITNIIPNSCREEKFILFTLGLMSESKALLKESLNWLEKAVEKDQSKNPFWLATLANMILHCIGKVDIVIGSPIFSEENKRDLLKVIELFTKAWNLLEEQKMRKLCIDWINKRGYAYSLLERWDDVLNDINLLLSIDPQNPAFLRNKAGYYAEIGNLDKAITLLEELTKQPQETENVDTAFLLFSELLTQKKDYDSAIAIIEMKLATQLSGEIEIDAKRLLIRLYLYKKEYDKANELNQRMLSVNSSNILFIIDEAMIQILSGNYDQSALILSEAKLLMTNQTELRPRIELARAYMSLKRYYEASEIFSTIENILFNNSLMRDYYIPSTYYSGNDQKTLELCNEYNKKFTMNPSLTEIQIEIYSEIGDLNRILELCSKFLKKDSNNPTIKLDLAICYFRLGRKEELSKILNEMNDYNFNFNNSVEFIRLLFVDSQNQRALEYLYNTLKKNFNNPEAHLHYVDLFISNQKRCETILKSPSNVHINTAVRLRNENNDLFWYTIVDDRDYEPSLNEIEISNQVVQNLINKKIGDRILIKRDFNQEEWIIEAIVSKYEFLFYLIKNNVNKWFPDFNRLYKIPIKNIPDLIKQQKDQTSKIIDLYKKGKLTIGS